MPNLRSVCVFLASTAACYGQLCNNHPLRPSLLPPCTTIGDQIAQALGAANDFNNRVNELNSAIEAARAKFWKAFPNGPGFDQAEKVFLAALWQKDVYYLMLTTVTGMNGNILDQVNVIGLLGGQVAPEDINKFPTNMDHGIRPYAFPLFGNRVNALRRAEGREKDGTFASPIILAKAIQDKSSWRKAYEDARNWAEFLSSGLEIARYVTPQVYLLRQMEAEVMLELARSKPADLPDPTAATLDSYNLFVKMFGEKEVVAAADSVLHTPKNSMGGLATRADVTVGVYEGLPNPNPLLLFLTKVTNSSPRSYAIALCFDRNAFVTGQATAAFMTKGQWEKAFSVYTQVIAKYGESNVLSAAAKLKDLPKDGQGGLRGDTQNRGTVGWFQALLKDPKTPVPEVGRFLASSYDPHWRGQTVEVRGTVSRVDQVKDTRPRWATIHFKEARNDAPTAFTPNSDMWQEKYGNDFAGLIGKPIEVWGSVEGWNEGVGVRITTSGQLKVFEAGALANFRESKPDWLHGPLAPSTNVDSPRYLAWKKFQPGAQATYETRVLHEYQPGTDRYTRLRISSYTMRLQSIDQSKAMIVAGTTTLTFRARESPGEDPDDLAKRSTTGEEVLVINGKKIATKWESVASPKGDPLTFTKTWRSDEVPGGLVLEHKHTHKIIVGQEYRDIEETIYAPVEGVEPEVGPENSSGPAPAGYVVQSSGPTRGTPPAVPGGRGRPATQAIPGTPPAPAAGAPRTSPAPASPPLTSGTAAQPAPRRTPEEQRQALQEVAACRQRAARDYPRAGSDLIQALKACLTDPTGRRLNGV